MQKEHLGFLYGILAALSSTVMALLIKWTQEVPNEMMVFIRFFIALLVFLPYIFRHRAQIHFFQVPRHFVRGLAGLGSMYCYFYSIEHLPLVTAITIFNTFALFIPVVIFFWLKLQIPKIRMLAVSIGFLGVVLILRPTEGFSEWILAVGLLGGMLSAIALVGIRQLSKVETTEMIMAHYFLISTVISFFPMVISWEPIARPMLWVNLVLIGIFSLIYQYCLTKSLTHAPSSKIGALSYLNVIFSGLLGWWFFAEVPTWWVLAGSILIIAGGLIAVLSKEEPKPWK